jgi:16S rRNA (cytosine1402-N4)-methyltransferase
VADGHVPVLFQETLGLLAPAPGEAFLDGTVDADPALRSMAAERLRRFPWVRMAHADFSDLGMLRDAAGGRMFDGMLLDLGLSSPQLDDPSRGFSFRGDGPLDMRRDPGAGGADAREIVRKGSERELADIFYRYGEERFSRRIARAIVAKRREAPIERTVQLADLVRSAIPRKAWPRTIHPATRVFQALRIAVNRELESLSAFLDGFAGHLAAGGRVAVISFHSLEDRMVKLSFRSQASGPAAVLRVLTRKPVVPQEMEIERNPRAASARLRAAVKT